MLVAHESFAQCALLASPCKRFVSATYHSLLFVARASLRRASAVRVDTHRECNGVLAFSSGMNVVVLLLCAASDNDLTIHFLTTKVCTE